MPEKPREERARPRNKGHVFAANELQTLLYSYGDVEEPLESTVTVLDEILTDFIIETCHAAATCASYSRRQKIKVDDFRWVLRHNSAMLGRLNEHLYRLKSISQQRKIGDFADMAGQAGGMNMEQLAEVAELGGAEQELKKKGKRGGKRKRKTDDDASDAKSVKRVAS